MWVRTFVESDLAAYVALLESLSPEDVRARFHSAAIPSPEQTREMLLGPAALGAVVVEARGRLRGIAHASRAGAPGSAEFGILVAPVHRRRGLGGALTDALLDALAARGSASVEAYTLWANAPAAALLRSRGFRGTHDGGGTVRWLLALSARRAS